MASAGLSVGATRPRRLFSDERIRANGITLHASVGGRGPAILLAHGMWCHQGMFTAVAEVLAQRHTVVNLDLRGHGASDVPETPYGIADLASDYVAVLDRFDLEHAFIAGFSMGGMAALPFALAHADRLRGLILMCTTASAEHLVRKAQIGGLQRLIQAVSPGEWLTGPAAAAMFTPGFRRKRPDAVAAWKRQVANMSRRALIQALEAIAARPSLVDRLAEITVPTLIVGGDQDGVAHPRESRKMRDVLPRGRLRVIAGVGHAVPIEKPEVTATLIRRFIEDVVD